MLDPKFTQYMTQAYAKVGDIGYAIAVNMRKGKDHIPKQQRYYDQGIRMYALMDVLLRHIYFDPTNNYQPVLYRITDVTANKLLRALIKIGELDTFPVVPTLFPQVKPITINQGPQGNQGVPGVNGTSANIVVQPAGGENEIVVTSSVVAGVTTYNLAFNLYTKPQMGLAINGGVSLFEQGSSNNIILNLTTTKGSLPITAITCISDSAINTILQSALNFTTLNGVTQPVLTQITVNSQTANVTYSFTITDGTNTVNVTISISFVYAMLYGSTVNATDYQAYLNSTKRIAAKSTQVINFNGINQYFWFGFPTSYGTVKIYDQAGRDITNAFTVFTPQSITSSGLATNYTTNYTFYRTTLKTTISNQNYTIVFQ